MNGTMKNGQTWDVIGFPCGGAFVEVKVGRWTAWFGIRTVDGKRFASVHGEYLPLD